MSIKKILVKMEGGIKEIEKERYLTMALEGQK
jgi:hypothetical protein